MIEIEIMKLLVLVDNLKILYKSDIDWNSSRRELNGKNFLVSKGN